MSVRMAARKNSITESHLLLMRLLLFCLRMIKSQMLLARQTKFVIIVFVILDRDPGVMHYDTVDVCNTLDSIEIYMYISVHGL